PRRPDHAVRHLSSHPGNNLPCELRPLAQVEGRSADAAPHRFSHRPRLPWRHSTAGACLLSLSDRNGGEANLSGYLRIVSRRPELSDWRTDVRPQARGEHSEW